MCQKQRRELPAKPTKGRKREKDSGILSNILVRLQCWPCSLSFIMLSDNGKKKHPRKSTKRDKDPGNKSGDKAKE